MGLKKATIGIYIGSLGLGILGIVYFSPSSTNITRSDLSGAHIEAIVEESNNHKASKAAYFKSVSPLLTTMALSMSPFPMVTSFIISSASIMSPFLSPSMSPSDSDIVTMSPLMSPMSPSMSPLMSPSQTLTESSPMATYLINTTIIPSPELTNQSPAIPMVTSTVSPQMSPMSPSPEAGQMSPTSITEPSPTPKETRSKSPGVVINEIGWMGTRFSASDEWIELYNSGAEDVSLEGWILKSDDNSPNISLHGSIRGFGYYLIERTNDDTISNISADLATSFGKGGLNNNGEKLTLIDDQGQVLEVVDCSQSWFSGDNSTKSSMERINPELPPDQSNWVTFSGISPVSHDGGGSLVRGTPGAKNGSLK